MIPVWVLSVLVFGFNFTLWGTIGFLRIMDGALDRFRRVPRNAGSGAHRARRAAAAAQGAQGERDPRPYLAPRSGELLTIEHVAVLMAAHNEEVVIDDSLAAITALVPPGNVHVVSDASTDATVALARQHGVNVIETAVNVGKAGALEEGILAFGLLERFRLVLLLDADTRLDPGYFAAALPVFDDPRVVAVAGCAHSNWHTPGLSFLGRLVTAHRSRIYALTQRLLKYGQTWRRTNATHIVPGFASLYRTAVLPHISINPRGLVIEDFNMTFEVYRKRLGLVGFTVAAKAVTQDPASVRDYVKQTKRWALGLWQTVRRHGLHLDLLSAMLCVLLLELLTASLGFLALPAVLTVLAVPDLFPAALHWHAAAVVHSAVAGHVSLRAVFLGVLAPDLLLTLVVAVVERRPKYLLYCPFFVFMRTIDAAIALYTLPRAWREKSTGRWVSPARRAPVGGAVPRPAGEAAERQAEPVGPASPAGHASPVEPAATSGGPAQPRIGRLCPITLDPPELAEVRTWWTRDAGGEASSETGEDDLAILSAAEPDPPGLAEIRTQWTRAAEAGSVEAQNNLAVLLATELDPPELREARMWWTRAARAGSVEAQNNLGLLFADLLDPPDLDQACVWWLRAAHAGHVGAQNNLGVLLADLVSPPDLDEARVWWTRAARAGSVEAQYGLGVLLAARADPADLAEARMWWAKAAEAGH
ncbi:MAG TPA: glycosyltransferase, partial [Streptosporangiaceae bacterium]